MNTAEPMKSAKERAAEREQIIAQLQTVARLTNHREDAAEVCFDWCPRCNLDAAIDGVQTLQAKPRVKPLEWNEYVDDKQTAIAVGAEYVVKRNWWRFCMGDQRGGPYHAASMDEAKAACEAHWQAAMKEYLL